MRCSAVTVFEDGLHAHCNQLTAVEGGNGLCHYHQRMADGEIEPCLDPGSMPDNHGAPTSVSCGPRGNRTTIWSHLAADTTSDASQPEMKELATCP